MLALLAAAGALAAVPTPTALPNLPPGFDANTLVAFRAPAAPVLDGSVDAVWAAAPSFEVTAFGASGSFPVGGGIKMRALYNSTMLFLLIEWADATEDHALSAWQLVNNTTAGGDWVRTNWGEDGISLILGNGTGLEQNFTAAGCGTLCHTGTVDEMRAETAGTLDVWRWSSALTELFGYVDDLFLDNQSKLAGSPTGGIHGDAADPFVNNTVTTAYGERPAFLNGSVPLNQSARYIATSERSGINWSTFNSSSMPNGTVVPGYVLSVPTGGRADVGAGSLYDGTGWRVELARPLVTADNTSRDMAIPDLDSTYYFSLSVNNNRTGENGSRAGFVYKLVFAGNALPDLTAQSVLLAQPSTLIGDPVNLTVRVHNGGFGNSTGTVFVAVVDDATMLEVANGTAPAITWNDDFLVNLSFSSVGYLPGAHNFTAAVDTANSENESFEANNSRAFQVTFVTIIALADLTVESAAGPTGTVFAGETFQLNGSVRNVGVGDSVFNVTVDAGHPSFGNQTVDLGPLMAGQGANFTFTFDATGFPSGDYAFTITVDPSNTVAESDESNNSLPVLATIEARPDLAADALVADPAAALQGATLNLTLTIKNRGAAFAGALEVWLYLDDANSTGAANRTDTWNVSVNLTRGAAANYTANWSIPSALPLGTHLLRAWLEALRAVDEVSEANNNGTVQITVLEPPTPDLAVASLTLGSTTMRPGENGTISVGVANLGIDYSTSVRVEAIEATVNRSLGNATVPAIPSGSTVVFTISFIVPSGTPGRHSILVIVDADDAVYEGKRELNNADSLNYTLLAPALPDLAIASVGYAPPSPAQGDFVALTAVVRNVGTAAAPASTVEFAWGNTVLATVAVPALAIGESYAASYVWNTSGVRSLAAQMSATAALPGGVGDLNLTNNSAPFQVLFAPPARPALHIDRVSALPVAPSPGDLVRIEARVYNDGGAAGEGTVLFRVDNAEIFRMIVALGPNESMIVSTNWTAGLPGPHTAKVELILNGTVVGSPTAPFAVVPPLEPPRPPAAAIALVALVALALMAAALLRRPNADEKEKRKAAETPPAREDAEQGGKRR